MDPSSWERYVNVPEEDGKAANLSSNAGVEVPVECPFARSKRVSAVSIIPSMMMMTMMYQFVDKLRESQDLGEKHVIHLNSIEQL